MTNVCGFLLWLFCIQSCKGVSLGRGSSKALFREAHHRVTYCKTLQVGSCDVGVQSKQSRSAWCDTQGVLLFSLGHLWGWVVRWRHSWVS
ncbi:hypothetical protein B0I72DRAFT_139520 [Yarrowia lipolytica]|uniref:Secreted protein n=1 Tax=Yarrowia lipolytica TaxID=4952 RepID=A0A371CBE3_YARLL|nr:hypothetical protein B0I71DRAFT_128885 [Yarrowia lipolytica]RDW31620.1 hypothetical protein B0I72DRAFT_139520 [Yarrowia lipolytica]RDW44276.1 hypothetical protein B0I74DRAFT_140720 [Yarrowia lipolytica]RDW51047.1 hypothetical protein B0I75DRAFT_140488 [Yarrowia lipolytica]